MSRYRAFYVPESFLGTWESFLEISRREGKNASVLIRGFVSEYVELHDPGNPQARITSYVEGGAVGTAVVEGRVRELFRALDSGGGMVRWREVVERCRVEVSDVSEALAMAKRVDKWLHSLNVKVWR